MDPEYDTEIDFNNLTQYIEKSLFCSICYSLIWDNIQCDNCSTLFCIECIDGLQNEYDRISAEQDKIIQPVCPYCRCIAQFTQNKYVDKLLKQINVICYNCDAKVKRNNYNDHLDICLGKKIICFLCNFEGRSKRHACTFIHCPLCNGYVHTTDKENHVSICPNIAVICDYCKSIMKRRELNDHHKNYCPKYEFACRFCNKNLIREKSIKHYDICIKAVIECSTCKQAYTKTDEHHCSHSLCSLCHEPYKTDEAEKHYKLSCAAIPIVCKNCGNKFSRSVILDHQLNNCINPNILLIDN
jgi:hypothetical protein